MSRKYTIYQAANLSELDPNAGEPIALMCKSGRIYSCIPTRLSELAGIAKRADGGGVIILRVKSGKVRTRILRYSKKKNIFYEFNTQGVKKGVIDQYTPEEFVFEPHSTQV